MPATGEGRDRFITPLMAGRVRARWARLLERDTVLRLIVAGADPNAVDLGGVTPLHRAVRNRCADAVSALLEGGATAP